MSSVRLWGRSKKPPTVEWEVDPYYGKFSWSGIELFVDLEVDSSPADAENVETVREISEAAIQQSEDPQDTANELGGTQEPSVPIDDDTRVIESTFLEDNANGEQEIAKALTSTVEACGVEDEDEKSRTQTTWPDWGEPLPPEEDSEDDMNVDYVSDVENNRVSQKRVPLSDVVTTIEPSCSLQEVRETGSFSYSSSSDDELEQDFEQLTSRSDGNSVHLSPPRVFSQEEEAACNLLELGNELNCSDMEVKASSDVFRSGRGNACDLRHDLERLSDKLEKLYAATPGLSIISGSQGSLSSEEVGSWTIDVLKDSGRVKMKRIKPEKGGAKGIKRSTFEDVDDENDVLERPPWKRHFKSLRKV